jgi:hypothetical protein
MIHSRPPLFVNITPVNPDGVTVVDLGEEMGQDLPVARPTQAEYDHNSTVVRHGSLPPPPNLPESPVEGSIEETDEMNLELEFANTMQLLVQARESAERISEKVETLQLTFEEHVRIIHIYESLPDLTGAPKVLPKSSIESIKRQFIQGVDQVNRQLSSTSEERVRVPNLERANSR